MKYEVNQDCKKVIECVQNQLSKLLEEIILAIRFDAEFRGNTLLLEK